MYGSGGVVEGAVLKENLPAILHLHDEPSSVGCLAVHVEIAGPVAVELAYLLNVLWEEVKDGVGGVLDDRIEEADEDVFVGFGTEELLEAEVDERINVSGLHSFN